MTGLRMPIGHRVASVLAALLVLVAASGCTGPRGPGKGDLAPEFVLSRLDGSMQKLRNYRGKIVVLNHWATWCPPCIAEMPVLDELVSLYADLDVIVVGLAADDDRERVRAFLETRPVAFDVLLDPDGAVGTEYAITGYPETFLIDRAGRIRDKIVGPIPHVDGKPDPEFVRRLEAVLGN